MTGKEVPLFMSKKILVFGSFVTDLTARADRLPREGETVKGNSFYSGPGGKGSNQAVAAHRAGADVLLVTKLGRDAFGQNAKSFYTAEGMCLDGILTDEIHETGAALILVDRVTAQNEIAVVLGACDHFDQHDMEAVYPLIQHADIVLAQLETNLEATEDALRYAKLHGCKTILNPAPAQPLSDELLKSVDIITPNETEASLLTGVSVDGSRDSVRQAAACFLKKGVRQVIITLGASGVYGTNGAQELFYPALDLGPVVDTTGAGDAFNGGFAAGLAQGYDFFEAIRYGSVVSGLAVTRQGTAPAMPYRQEIQLHYAPKEENVL